MKRILILVLCGVLTLGYLVITAEDEPDIAEHVEAEFDQMVAEAHEENPDMPVSMAAQKKAQAVQAEQLAAASTSAERALMAASHFWGFFYVQTRARPEYCTGLNVDITPFTEALRAAHEDEIAIATRIFDANKIPLEETWATIQPTLMKAIRQDMQDLQAAKGVSPEGACRLFADQPDAFVETMLLRDKSPDTHRILMEAAQAAQAAADAP